jgi:hypothetical protein
VVAHRGSVTDRAWVRGQGGAAAAYKGSGRALACGTCLGGHARGGLGGGAGEVRVGDDGGRG